MTARRCTRSSGLLRCARCGRFGGDRQEGNARRDCRPTNQCGARGVPGTFGAFGAILVGYLRAGRQARDIAQQTFEIFALRRAVPRGQVKRLGHREAERQVNHLVDRGDDLVEAFGGSRFFLHPFGVARQAAPQNNDRLGRAQFALDLGTEILTYDKRVIPPHGAAVVGQDLGQMFGDGAAFTRNSKAGLSKPG